MANEECSHIKQETIAISKPESDNELTHIYENIVDMKKSYLDMVRKMDILIELLSKKS
jgi:hypothetical protein